MPREMAAQSSEVPFLLFALHGRPGVGIDDAIAALGKTALHRLANDVGDGHGVALDRARQRIATQRPKPYSADLRLFGRLERETIIVDEDQHFVAADDRPRSGEIQRDDRYPLPLDVEPHVEFGPVRQRKHAETFALAFPGVVKAPRLGALPLWIP